MECIASSKHNDPFLLKNTMQPEAKTEKGNIVPGGNVVVKPLQRWPVTTLFALNPSPIPGGYCTSKPIPAPRYSLLAKSAEIVSKSLHGVPSSSDPVSGSKKVSELTEDVKSTKQPSKNGLSRHRNLPVHVQKEVQVQLTTMKPFRLKSGEDTKGRTVEVDRKTVVARVTDGDRFRRDFIETRPDSYNGDCVFHSESQGEYEKWRRRTSGEDILVNCKNGIGVDNYDEWRTGRLSTDNHQPSTFSDNSVSRRWRFDSEHNERRSPVSDTPNKWRVSFDGIDELRTNIDDLIRGMEQREKWAFGNPSPDNPQFRHSSNNEAWASSNNVTGMEDNQGNAFQPNPSWSIEFLPKEDDRHSVDTASTDAETEFRAEEEESWMNEQRRQFLKEMALRGKGHAIDRLTSGHVPTWNDRENRAAPVPSQRHSHKRTLENSATDVSSKGHKRTNSYEFGLMSDHDQLQEKIHHTLPADYTLERQRITSMHCSESPLEMETCFSVLRGESPKPNSYTESQKRFHTSPKLRRASPLHHRNSPMQHKNPALQQKGSQMLQTISSLHHTESPSKHTHSPKPRMNLPVLSEDSPKIQRNSLQHHINISEHKKDSPRPHFQVEEQLKHCVNQVPTEMLERWRMEDDGDEDERTAQQRRLDAWVWSIQTHCDSTDSSEFPFSFEDSFLALQDGQREKDMTDIFCDFLELEYEDHEVELFMTDDDKRFGFSVVGGYDEGITPRVDDITLGSPADRAELEVGDEIMEVNGKCVNSCPHSEIISHIHECIRSKSIRLRVKRLKEGEKVPAISKVHDAYIIAVEESARKKLEDASANHRVVPVDMTRPPPAYKQEAVTTFREQVVSATSVEAVHSLQLQTSEQQPVKQEQQQHTPLQSLEPSCPPRSKSVSPTKPPRKLNLQHKLTQQQQCGTQDTNPKEDNHRVEQNPVNTLSMPVSEKKRNSGLSKNGGLNGSVEALEMNGMMMEKERDSPRKGKGGKGKKGEGRGSKAISNPDAPLIEDMISQGGLAPNGKSTSHNSLNHSSNDLSMYDMESETGFQHSPSSSLPDSGPHREMAIDCPDSFVATVKSPPRYPPPQNNSSGSVPRVPPTTPSKSSDSMRDKARTDATLSDAALVVAGGSQPKPTSDQLERLRKHQEELRKRREEENRQQLEQDFLRTSLRGSKKLQALENRRMAHGQQAAPPIGIVNTAFVDAEDDEEGEELVDDVDGTTTTSSTQPVPTERYLKKNAGVEDFLSTLHHIRSRLNSADNTSSGSGSQEVFFLKQLFHNVQFQQAVSMHQRMVDITSKSPQPCPLGTDSQDLAVDISSSSPVRTSDPAMKELATLLNKPHIKNVLKAHDEVAERQTQPVLHTSESDLIDYPLVQYGEESVKIIHLEKTNEHLGATVRNEGDSVIIARIVKGGAAEKSGLLHEGDEILDVNGIDMRGKNVNEVSDILANMSGTITFMIIPAHTCVDETTAKPGEIMHLRALFNYDPEDDRYIPCRELGISFLKGDILHATQLTDPSWWQAHREGEEDQHMLAGLIPSKSFQEQRESIRQQLNAESKENKKRSRVCACGRKERKKRKKKKALYNGGEDTEEILTYEEVTRYYPQPNRKRPIILVGPPDVGRQELREHIMESDFDRFAAAVPHTSRPPGAGEQHGKDYFFISRPVFEADTLSGKFIEYGEFQGNLYGTSVEAIRQIIMQGRICILNLQPESLKQLRETDLKPYVIFVSPPNMEKLRQLQMALGKPRPTDDQLKEVIEKGREMEETYGHYFDYVLVNMNLERSYEELLQEINRIETEPQWVPVGWISYM